MSTEEKDHRTDPADDLELSADEAGSVKGGLLPIEDGGIVGRFLAKKKKKKKATKKRSPGGGRPV